MMKVLTILMLATIIMFFSCGRKAKKIANNTETIDSITFLKPEDMNITTQEWKEILERDSILKKQFDDEYFDGYNLFIERDLELGMLLAEKLFQKQGWKPVSDSDYVARIKYIYGIDLDGRRYPKDSRLRPHKNYTIYFMGNPETQYWSSNRNDIYFYRKQRFSFPEMNVHVTYLCRDKVGNVQFNDLSWVTMYYHWNNFLLKNSRASLVKMTNDETFVYYFYDLVYYFGFDKEEIINKKTLNHLLLHVESYYSDYNHLFAAHDIYGELDIRDGLLSTVASLTSKDTIKYYTMLENYTRCCVEAPLVSGNYIQDVLFKEFNADERRKIIACCLPTLQTLYDEYYSEVTETVSPVIIEIVNADPDMVPQWQKQDYYGLQDLQKIVEKLPKRD